LAKFGLDLFLAQLNMKRGFSRFKADPVTVERAIRKYLSGGYVSKKAACYHLPFSAQRFGTLVKQYQHKHAGTGSEATPKEYSRRDFIDDLKRVSAVVADERKKKNGRSTAKILQDLNTPQLLPCNVNKHVAKGLAGQSPSKRGRHQILSDDAVIRVIDYAKTCADDLEPLAVRELNETTQSLIEGTEIQSKFKHGVVSKGHTQRLLKTAADVLQTEFPQNMTHDRSEWCTYANIMDYFDIMQGCFVEMNISTANPRWDETPELERESKGMVPIIHQKPGNICGADEMPFGLDMNTGQKSKQDKKITAVNTYEAAFGGRHRKKMRGRQRTSKFNKLGTLVYGSKGNCEPLIPMLIVKGTLMKPEYTYSEIIGVDGELIKQTLSKVFSTMMAPFQFRKNQISRAMQRMAAPAHGALLPQCRSSAYILYHAASIRPAYAQAPAIDQRWRVAVAGGLGALELQPGVHTRYPTQVAPGNRTSEQRVLASPGPFGHRSGSQLAASGT
jgi:hypothetical protein